MSDALPPAPNHVAQFFGFILLVIGVLWLAFAGLCTAGMLATAVVSDGIELGGIATVLMIGGVSLLCGWGIFALGRAIVWPNRNAPPPPPP